MRKIIVILCLTLLICLPVQANPVTILGVGEVDLPRDITVTQGLDNKGNANYFFKAKDGGVWRAAMLMPISRIASNEYNDFLKMDTLLDKVIQDKLSNKNTLDIEKAKQITIGGKACTMAALKMEASTGGIIANMDIMMIPGSDGLKMFGYVCADGDTHYWRPIMQKIAANIR